MSDNSTVRTYGNIGSAITKLNGRFYAGVYLIGTPKIKTIAFDVFDDVEAAESFINKHIWDNVSDVRNEETHDLQVERQV